MARPIATALASATLMAAAFLSIPSYGAPSYQVAASVARQEDPASSSWIDKAGQGMGGEQATTSLQAPPIPTAVTSPSQTRTGQRVQTLRQTTLWAQSVPSSAKATTLPEKNDLQVIGSAENGRLPVYYDNQRGQKMGGWVDPADVQGRDPLARVATSSRGGPRPTPDISTHDKFIAAVADAAQDAKTETRVPVSVTIAQAILESDWGQSGLSSKANNFFGIKAQRGPGPAGVIKMNTWEVFSGQSVTVNDAFRAYHNLYESVLDHGRFLLDNPRYVAAFQVVDNAQEFARRIHSAGYATDPAYSTKLINIMNKFNLYQFDR